MIANTFIKRPVTAIVISIVLVLTGAICIFILPIDQYPDITPPIVQVTAQFTGADAQTVEQTVATPIEQQVNGTPGMEYMQSNSTNNGLMTMNVTFNIGTDIDVASAGRTEPRQHRHPTAAGRRQPSWRYRPRRQSQHADDGGYLCPEGNA